MRFIYIDRSCKVNGCTTFVLLLGEALVKRGHEFIYAARGGPLSPQFEQVGAQHLKTLCKPFNKWQIDRHLRSHPQDVFLCSGRGQTVTALKLAEAHRRPSICFVQDPLRPEDTLEVMMRPNALVTPEAQVYADLLKLGVPAEKATLIPRPIRARELAPPPVAGFSLLFIGRLSENKWAAPRALVEAVPGIHKEIPELRVSIVGTGAKLKAIAALAGEANRECGSQVIEVVGQTLDPLGWMERANLVVAGGYACMEAVYNGRPAIAAGYGWFGPVERGSVAAAVDCHFGDRREKHHEAKWMRDAVIAVHNALQDPTAAARYTDLRGEFAEDHSPDACAQTVEKLAAELIARAVGNRTSGE
jgi:hypothetical protein